MHRLLCLFPLALAAQAPGALDARVERLLRDILIFDAHIDTPRYFLDEGYRLADEHGYYELDLPRMRKGRMGAVFFGVFAQPQDYPQAQWMPRSMEVLDALHEELKRVPRDVEFARTSADVLRIHKAGRIAALASLEGGHLFHDSLPVLRQFARLGIRYITLAHFRNSIYADSMTDTPRHGGLSEAGRELIGEMNRLGMIPDVSHISDKAVLDTVAASRAPVIASHSSVKAIAPIPRNMPDEIIRAIASKGGVMCINFHAGYLDEAAYDVYIRNREARDREIKTILETRPKDPSRWELIRGVQKKYFEKMPKVPLARLEDHIDHVARLVGADHVGLGSDFDGVSGMVPVGMEDVSKYPALVRALAEKGYSDADIRKIMGLNLIRVMKANEEVAAR